MAEIIHQTFTWQMPNDIYEMQRQIKPQAWAEAHFMERVSGVPWNPPPSAQHWASKTNGHADYVDANGQFSHTYPERFWCTRITSAPAVGIRYAWGDLSHVITLLRERPGTRQAFLPVWFPEDTGGSRVNQRVPCTLGYLFLIRQSKLHIAYYIRSCDYYRHFRDDVYMAARLAHWMVDQVTVGMQELTLGQLTMHIGSLHVFERDLKILASAERLDSDGHR